MNNNITLYKYRKINNDNLALLRNNQIYVPSPPKLNDPFDCSIGLLENLFTLIDQKEREMNIIHDLKIREEEFLLAATNRKEVLSEYINSLGIYSLSEMNNSIKLWSLYAVAHTGFCIGCWEHSQADSDVLRKG